MDVDSLTDDEEELSAYRTTEENHFTAGTKHLHDYCICFRSQFCPDNVTASLKPEK
jgi:hypothetical protein